MESANPSSTLGTFSQEPPVTTHAKFTARINKLLQMRQTIDSFLFKTINELTNQSSNSEIFCPKERIKELESRTQQQINFVEELFKDRFPTEKELAYHKELLGEPQPPFSTLEPKIKRGDPRDNVKMLLEGYELTKEDCESQLYDDFEHFRQKKGETIHDYYNLQGRQNRGQGNNARGIGAAGNGGVQNRVRNANPGQARQIKCYNYNGIGHIARNNTQLKRPQNSEYFKDKMLLMQAQENGLALDEEQLLFIAGGHNNDVDEDVDEQPVQDLALNVDNVFQADDCDAFDSDVDEAPTA
ncbi:hypothetical protein Tco_0266615 [Tanacetum coccineum]